ncbi:hypothetical protein [Clostridium botulinum]|uniref:hypothetical protein n=1 Tax=Clostridium botulinum TaxID=1491 RepID=UPI0012690D80|nr:hypothetical protein [Clostridium botulinum]
MPQNTYKKNKQNGFKVQANKELTKVKQICRLRLTPEIEDLKIKLKNNSPQEILQRYPNLENIILNLCIIEKEIQIWMKKN